MRTFKKDVFTVLTADEAEKYIGKKGFFSNVYINNTDSWDIGTLTSVNYVFADRAFTSDNCKHYALFIPYTLRYS